MAQEMLEPNKLITALLEAAKNENWGKVDEELIPQLSSVDANATARELLGHTDDPNPDIRDVVASSFSALDITDKETKSAVLEKMRHMAIADKEVFAAGRAATVLLGNQDDEDTKSALQVFRRRVESEGWQKDLEENIPELIDFLKSRQ